MQYGRLIEGLQIFAKYEDKGLDAYIAGAEHDIIYGAGADVDEDAETIEDKYGDPVPVDKRMSAEDQKRLRELGWFLHTDTESWRHSSKQPSQKEDNGKHTNCPRTES